MIKKASQKLAKWIGAQSAYQEDKSEIYAYGLEIILGGILKIGLLLFIAFKLDILLTTLLCTIGFVGIRFFGGGGHFTTYTRCLVGTLAILLISGKVAAYNSNVILIFIFILLSICFGTFAIILWVPAGTHKKTVTNEEKRIKQKSKTLIMLIIHIGLALTFIQYKLYSLAFSLVLGMLSGFFLITPLGYFLLQSIDNFLDLLQRKQDTDLAK